jgi:hypothetical protein
MNLLGSRLLVSKYAIKRVVPSQHSYPRQTFCVGFKGTMDKRLSHFFLVCVDVRTENMVGNPRIEKLCAKCSVVDLSRGLSVALTAGRLMIGWLVSNEADRK